MSSHVVLNPATHHPERLRPALLVCGILGALLYPLADLFAASRYPGFSIRDHAVSELFAIGAPTAGLLVPLFTVASGLMLLFSWGIWMSAEGRRIVKWLAAMMALNFIDALVLWNAFPMHMRGEKPGFTDLMHGLLAIDPFLMVGVILAAVAFPGRFRRVTIGTLVFTTGLALTSIVYVPLVVENAPTPWMGACERAGQYAMNVWYAYLAWKLLKREVKREDAPVLR